MSFQPDNLNEVRSRGREPLVVSLWTYWTTTDTVADVSADDYWGASGKLSPKDLIDCVCSDGHVRLKIDAIDSSEDTSAVSVVNGHRTPLTSVTLTPGSKPTPDGEPYPFGFVTGLIVVESPNPNWVAGTYDITDAIGDNQGTAVECGPTIGVVSVTVDGSGNAVVTVNPRGTEGVYSFGSQLNSLNGSLLGGVDDVDNFTLEVSTVAEDLREIDLTKDINRLPRGWYHVADGEEGQVIHFVSSPGPKGIEVQGFNLFFDNVHRADSSSLKFYLGSTEDYFTTYVVGSHKLVSVTAVFIGGAWAIDANTLQAFDAF